MIEQMQNSAVSPHKERREIVKRERDARLRAVRVRTKVHERSLRSVKTSIIFQGLNFFREPGRFVESPCGLKSGMG